MALTDDYVQLTTATETATTTTTYDERQQERQQQPRYQNRRAVEETCNSILAILFSFFLDVNE